MKGRPVDQLVYEHMFPKKRSQDPQNFHALLQRHLILEVRQEVHSFYGHLETNEAMYPGLDYTNHIHRIRLSRWQWHRRLFRAFDALHLTPNEIAALTKWEGTRWAKERYEREQNTVIRDTAADGMPRWVELEDRFAMPEVTRHMNEDLLMEEVEDAEEDEEEEGEDTEEEQEENEEDEDSEGELESVGIALNERLLERVAARNAGDLSLSVDEAWEQWFKNAVETGEISHMRERLAHESPQDLFPLRFIDAARTGHWHEIPEFLRDLIRDGLLAEENRLRGLRPGASTTGARLIPLPSPSSSSSSSSPSILNLLSAPLPSFSQHGGARRSATRTLYSTGLRIPGAFQGVDDGGTSRTQRSEA